MNMLTMAALFAAAVLAVSILYMEYRLQSEEDRRKED